MKTTIEVIKLYNKNFKKKKEHEKVLWSSHKAMLSRYKILFRLLRLKKIKKWIDIGSGTGAIFKFHEKTNIKIRERIGIEINKRLFFYSKKKKYKFNTNFFNIDFLKYKTKKKFDLITLIGVLQNCGYDYSRILKKVKKIMNKNATLFLTSKNVNFKYLHRVDLSKNNHQWLDPILIKKLLEKNGIKIIKINSFNSQTNRIVKLNNSSNFFIYGKNIK
ncbi:BioC, biotin biosynthesis protein BioC [Candidatus Pelagibacterales bacterium]